MEQARRAGVIARAPTRGQHPCKFEYRGDQAVSNGWLERAHRLLDGIPRGVDHGWLAPELEKSRSGLGPLLQGDGDAEVIAGIELELGRAEVAIAGGERTPIRAG